MTRTLKNEPEELLIHIDCMIARLEEASETIKQTNYGLGLKLNVEELSKAVAFTKAVLRGHILPINELSTHKILGIDESISAIANLADRTKDGLMVGKRSGTDSVLQMYDEEIFKDIFAQKVSALKESAKDATVPDSHNEQDEAYQRYKDFLNNRRPPTPEDM